MPAATYTVGRMGGRKFITPTSTGQILLGTAIEGIIGTMAVGVDLNSGTLTMGFKGRPRNSATVIEAGVTITGYALGAEPYTLASQQMTDWAQVDGGTSVSASNMYLVRAEGSDVIADVTVVTGSPRIFYEAYKG